MKQTVTAPAYGDASQTFYQAMQVWGALGVLFAVMGAIPFLRFFYFLAQGTSEGHVWPLFGGLGMFALGALVYVVGLWVTSGRRNGPPPSVVLEEAYDLVMTKHATRRGVEHGATEESETANEETERETRVV